MGSLICKISIVTLVPTLCLGYEVTDLIACYETLKYHPDSKYEDHNPNKASCLDKDFVVIPEGKGPTKKFWAYSAKRIQLFEIPTNEPGTEEPLKFFDYFSRGESGRSRVVTFVGPGDEERNYGLGADGSLIPGPCGVGSLSRIEEPKVRKAVKDSAIRIVGKDRLNLTDKRDASVEPILKILRERAAKVPTAFLSLKQHLRERMDSSDAEIKAKKSFCPYMKSCQAIKDEELAKEVSFAVGYLRCSSNPSGHASPVEGL
jgi:hypothetical protein